MEISEFGEDWKISFFLFFFFPQKLVGHNIYYIHFDVDGECKFLK